MTRLLDLCVAHRKGEVAGFLSDYFTQDDRRVLLVAGAGFDPRSCVAASQFAAVGVPVRALFIRENRPSPPQGQMDRASANMEALLAAVPDHEIVPVEIFGSDGAVIGGRNITTILHKQSFDGLTDIVVDVSALSVGISFPIIRYFAERIGRSRGPNNLHVLAAHDPRLDASIRCSTHSDASGYVHGFKGRSNLSSEAEAARLWLPQLARGQRRVLGRLYNFVEPHDTCPILPFPASDPRLGDSLAAEYLTELESTWSVDMRNIVYADESDPLDLYRTILRLDDLRRPVFAETGRSMLVLSPLGSKVMALGALMAALERNLPVAYLEPISYEMDESIPVEPDLVHIWLEGEVYQRPALLEAGRAVP